MSHIIEIPDTNGQSDFEKTAYLRELSLDIIPLLDKHVQLYNPLTAK